MDQALALEIMGAGENVLLTGPAGSGKTYVLNEFIRRAKRSKKYVAVTATTGLAATHLAGNTIHAWSGIGIHEELPRHFLDYLTKSRREIIEKTDVLIIDEISMLHDYRLDMVDQAARAVRGQDAPFGGIQVILCGDFFQLPPVNRDDGRQGGFVVESAAWRDLDPVICYLNEQHRQDDTSFLEILGALRSSDIRRRHVEALLARQSAKLDDKLAVTELHVTNVDVDSINHARLAGLSGKEHRFSMSSTGKDHYVQSLQRSCLAHEELLLKKGALVMCVRNHPERKYVNGSLGVVTGFEATTDYPIVELNSGRKIVVVPETWELRDGNRKRASITQIPLRLAWAITVHKSQGMTLDAARVDLSKAFVPGMGYVALSRVRGLDTLSLVGLNRMALSVSPEAVEIDNSLRNHSAHAAQRFAHLRELARERAAEQPKDEAPSDWKEKLEKMRETYPNAYRPWLAADDERLLKSFQEGKGVRELTGAFGRHPGSIRSRLRKHLGDEIKIPR